MLNLLVCKHGGVTACAVTSRQVHDGKDTSSRPLGVFTRGDLLGLVLNSTSNHLWLEFNTNGSGTDRGFQLTYTSK